VTGSGSLIVVFGWNRMLVVFSCGVLGAVGEQKWCFLLEQGRKSGTREFLLVLVGLIGNAVCGCGLFSSVFSPYLSKVGKVPMLLLISLNSDNLNFDYSRFNPWSC